MVEAEEATMYRQTEGRSFVGGNLYITLLMAYVTDSNDRVIAVLNGKWNVEAAS